MKQVSANRAPTSGSEAVDIIIFELLFRDAARRDLSRP